LKKIFTKSENIESKIDKIRSEFVEFSLGFDFPAIDAEAMFVGTIIHGIDHANLYDVSSMRAPGREQSICSDTGDFRLMEEIARITIAGLASDLPGIGFAHQYRDSPHPFYQKVYAFAKKINKTYADRMDACIIK
jgi:hypothetical protein